LAKVYRLLLQLADEVTETPDDDERADPNSCVETNAALQPEGELAGVQG
jgi:hypothetical protein